MGAWQTGPVASLGITVGSAADGLPFNAGGPLGASFVLTADSPRCVCSPAWNLLVIGIGCLRPPLHANDMNGALKQAHRKDVP